MALVSWSFPTSIVFGNGALATLADKVRALGKKRVLVVADRGVVAAGVVARVTAALGDIPSRVFDAVDPNPVEKNVTDGVAAFREHQADIIVSVGGGSPLDAGKLIALATTHHRPLQEYDDAIGGDAHIGPDVPPIITIPTTAGTGSEVGRSGVVTLAATGFDALTHCLEAYCSKGDHPMADAIALGGLELAADFLAKAVHDPNDLEARGAMMKAAMMGAVAFQKGLGACHSLAHPLSSEKGMHHGLANALCLPAVVAFNAPAIPERLERCRKIIDASAKDIEAAVIAFRTRVGIQGGLGAHGVTKADIEKLSAKAFEDACHRSNPKETSREDLAKLYEAAL